MKTRNFKRIEVKEHDHKCASGSACGCSSQQEGQAPNTDITSLFVAVTSACNLSCSYCCRYEVENKISAADVISAIDQIPTLERVKLSGGEVTINFLDCIEIVKYCSERGLETQINSNATLLNEDKLRALDHAGLDYLHISFDFIDREEYAKYYKTNARMHDRIIENIKFAQEQTNIDVIVETIICKETADTILDIHDYLHGLGVKIHEIQNGIPQEKAGCWSEVTSPRETIDIMKKIIRHKKADTELYFSCTGFDMEREGSSDDFKDYANTEGVYFPGCIAAKHQLHLASNGDVLLCELGCPEVTGNIFKGQTISEIISNSSERRGQFNDEHHCRRATFFNAAEEAKAETSAAANA